MRRHQRRIRSGGEFPGTRQKPIELREPARSVSEGQTLSQSNEVNMEHARAGLQKIVADSLRRAPAEEAAVLAWPLVCGTAVADKNQALGGDGGVVPGQVTHAAWPAPLVGLAAQDLAAA